MATTKKPKKQKLRNAEYYNLQETFDILFADSKNGKRFTKLMPIILSEQNICLAYKCINCFNHSALICQSVSHSPDLGCGDPMFFKKSSAFIVPIIIVIIRKMMSIREWVIFYPNKKTFIICRRGIETNNI